MSAPQPPGEWPYNPEQAGGQSYNPEQTGGQPYYPPAPPPPQYDAGPYQQQPYPYQQPYGYPYGPPQSTNGMAIASMVLGILWLYWIGSILALIFGYVARNQIKRTGQSGDGMAIAGIVLGWVGIGVLGVGLVIALAAYANR